VASAGFDLWSVSLTDAATARAIEPPVGIAGVAVDSTSLYFSAGLPNGLGSISRADKDGGNAQPIAPNQSFPFLLALDDAYVYWTDLADNGSVDRVQKDGGAVLQLATGTKPNMIAVDDRYVYWTIYGTAGASNGTLYRTPKGGGTTIILAPFVSPSDIAVDDSYVYVATNGTVPRVAK
jgi:hypothetical protein